MIGRIQARVSQPIADHGHIDTGGDQLDTHAVAAKYAASRASSPGSELAGGRLNIVRLSLNRTPVRTERLSRIG